MMYLRLLAILRIFTYMLQALNNKQNATKCYCTVNLQLQLNNEQNGNRVYVLHLGRLRSLQYHLL